MLPTRAEHDAKIVRSSREKRGIKYFNNKATPNVFTSNICFILSDESSRSARSGPKVDVCNSPLQFRTTLSCFPWFCISCATCSTDFSEQISRWIRLICEQPESCEHQVSSLLAAYICVDGSSWDQSSQKACPRPPRAPTTNAARSVGM